MYSFHDAAVCSFFGGPLNIKIRQNVEKHHGLSLPPSIRSTSLYHFCIKHWSSKNICT